MMFKKDNEIRTIRTNKLLVMNDGSKKSNPIAQDFLDAGWIEYISPVVEDTTPEYIVQRQMEYPSIGDQLDMQYWDKINDTAIWQETIQAIKDKYPKPE